MQRLTSVVSQGAITMFVGFLTMYLLPDFPHNTRWLSPQERRLAQVLLAEDAGEADEDTGTDTYVTSPRCVVVHELTVCIGNIGHGAVSYWLSRTRKYFS